MTPAEFKTYVETTYDSINNFAAPGYEDDEINVFLNAAQERYVKKLYNANSNLGDVGFEETEKRSKDLSELKRFANITPGVAGDYPNGVVYDLPEALWWTLAERVDLTYTNACGVATEASTDVKPIREGYYNSNIKNPYQKPSSELVWRIDKVRTDINAELGLTNPKRHELISGDGMTLGTYYVSYMKYPKAIDVTQATTGYCELDPAVHRTIADEAVVLMLEAARQPRFRTSIMKDQGLIE